MLYHWATDSTVSEVYYEVHMIRVLHTARISNFDSVVGTQNFFFVPRSWQDEKRISLKLLFVHYWKRRVDNGDLVTGIGLINQSFINFKAFWKPADFFAMLLKQKLFRSKPTRHFKLFSPYHSLSVSFQFTYLHKTYGRDFKGAKINNSFFYTDISMSVWLKL